MRFITTLMMTSVWLFATIELPENFNAKFDQKITNTKKHVIDYHGTILFSRPNRFKWSYTKPTKKEVCTDGVELLVIDHDLEQVANYQMTKGLDIAKILKKAKLYRTNVYLAEYENTKYTIQVDKDQRLHSIAYFDDLDNKVQIVFKQMQYGKGKIPSSQLRCDYPKSYDMIRD